MRISRFSTIETEFAGVLANILELKKQQRWSEVGDAIGRSFYRLLGIKTNEVSKRTQTELLALVLQRGPTAVQPYRQMMLIALLKEAGDYASANYPPNGGRGWYLMALYFLCDMISHQKLPEWPGVALRIPDLIDAIDGSTLPISAHMAITRAYERQGSFAQAAAQIKAAFKQAPEHPRVLRHAIAIFERLRAESDESLLVQGLCRQAIEKDLAELRGASTGY